MRSENDVARSKYDVVRSKYDVARSEYDVARGEYDVAPVACHFGRRPRRTRTSLTSSWATTPGVRARLFTYDVAHDFFAHMQCGAHDFM